MWVVFDLVILALDFGERISSWKMIVFASSRSAIESILSLGGFLENFLDDRQILSCTLPKTNKIHNVSV